MHVVDLSIYQCFQFNRPMWEVLTGRRDGTISNAFDVVDNIPAPFLNFTQLMQNFRSKNLTMQDLVVLSGKFQSPPFCQNT